MRAVERLTRFVRRVEEMQRLPIFEGNNFASSFTLKWRKGVGMNLSAKQPDEDMVRSHLLAFRMFIAEGSDMYLGRIFNEGHQHIRSEQIRGFLVDARQQWIHMMKQGYFGLTWNDKKIPPEKVADLWINGYYFHDDPAKREFLDRLGLWEPWVIRMHFMTFVTDVTEMVLYVGHVVRIALKDGLVDDGDG